MEYENATVYINRYPDRHYAMVTLDGYVEIKELVREKDYLLWERQHKKDGLKQIRICHKDIHPERLEELIAHVKDAGARVMIRDRQGYPWEEI